LAEKRVVDGRAKIIYRMADENDTIRILKILSEKDNDSIGWILPLLYENDIEAIKGLNGDIKDALTKKMTKNHTVFLIKTNPFEDTKNAFFEKLRKAVENAEHTDIIYEYETTQTLKSVKCLKLIFINNNWYLACETQSHELRLLRISFIKYVNEAKGRYQRAVPSKYKSYFENMQNAMTLYDVKTQEALLKADSKISRYFKKEMKPFLISQKFVKEERDGGIIFSVKYTQPLEILPFIKNWLPYIKILEPQTLQAELKKELEEALSLYF
jgi:predicted DNA-binding transcriptional regulator YafY